MEFPCTPPAGYMDKSEALVYFADKYAGYWRREVETGFRAEIYDMAMHEVVHKWFGEHFPYDKLVDEVRNES